MAQHQRPGNSNETLMYQRGYTDGYTGQGGLTGATLQVEGDCADAATAEVQEWWWQQVKAGGPNYMDQLGDYGDWYARGCQEAMADREAGRPMRNQP